MQTILRTLAILVIAVALVPMAQAGTATAQPEQVNTGDELVIITGDGRLRAVDPYTPPGYVPVAWESPVNGFTDVATGDFNGDGSDEVVGLRGGEAIVYDPVRRPGEPDVARVLTATPGQIWRNVVTGDLDGDGADEIVLVESTSSTAEPVRMVAFKFTSTGWVQTFSQMQGLVWQGLATGDVMGNGRDQVIGIRNGGGQHQILIFDPFNAWQLIFNSGGFYGFPWVALAVGDVSADGMNKDELVTTRSGVQGQFSSMLIFRWMAGSSTLQDVAGATFFPEFRWIALADVSGIGVKDVFLLRPGLVSGESIIALTNFRVGSAPPVAFNELAGQDKWNGIQAGDLDADGRDEIIVMSANEYLVYNQPDTNTAAVSFPGSYSTTGRFAVGNLDGPGVPDVPPGPVLNVAPLTIPLTLQAGQNASQPISITNTGAGTMAWEATVLDSATWLSMSPSSGTAPSTAQLLVNTGGLAPGSYEGRVRIDGSGGAANSPQTITVNLTVTAPQFAVQPNRVSWTYTPPANPGVRTVTLTGQNVVWHAGLVPMPLAAQIEQAVAAGQSIKLQDGVLWIGDDAEGTPVVDWIDINPVTGVAVPGGIFVDLTLVLDRVPYGVSSAAVVFVAETVASPPAVVVRAGVLRTLPNATDLYFLPLIVRGQ